MLTKVVGENILRKSYLDVENEVQTSEVIAQNNGVFAPPDGILKYEINEPYHRFRNPFQLYFTRRCLHG
jgi:hypothetical protein